MGKSISHTPISLRRLNFFRNEFTLTFLPSIALFESTHAYMFLYHHSQVVSNAASIHIFPYFLLKKVLNLLITAFLHSCLFLLFRRILYISPHIELSKLSGIKRLTKYSYVNIYTGEVSEYAVNSNKIDNTTSIKQSLKRLRLLIMNNFTEFESFLITLTYSSEMTNFEQAADDYRKFYDNLKYHYKEYKFEYIRIIEPTGNGIWHIHILIKSAVYVEKFFIQQSVVQNLWKHGSVKIRQIYDTASLAAYFCTYSNNENVKAKRKPRHLIKQSMWKYYPRNAKIYTKSRGIKAPDCIQITRGEVDSILVGYARVSANSLISRIETPTLY